MTTIRSLAERQEKLEAELAEVREEIARRAGEVDAPVRKAVKAQKATKATKAV